MSVGKARDEVEVFILTLLSVLPAHIKLNPVITVVTNAPALVSLLTTASGVIRPADSHTLPLRGSSLQQTRKVPVQCGRVILFYNDNLVSLAPSGINDCDQCQHANVSRHWHLKQLLIDNFRFTCSVSRMVSPSS